MKLIFDRKNYKNYKNFYEQIYKDLDGKHMIDWEEYDNLSYSADALDEFLWYCKNDSNEYVFVNFDKEKIKKQKNFDDYKYNIILEIFEDFVKKYPNNTLRFENKKTD